MNIQHYFGQLQKAINRVRWLIENESITFEHEEASDTGFVEGRIVFIDGSILEFSETVGLAKDYYRFHYMDVNKRLIIRWDSAPHHKEVRTFPYHKHTARGVISSKGMSLKDVLLEIEQVVSEKF